MSVVITQAEGLELLQEARAILATAAKREIGVRGDGQLVFDQELKDAVPDLLDRIVPTTADADALVTAVAP